MEIFRGLLLEGGEGPLIQAGSSLFGAVEWGSGGCGVGLSVPMTPGGPAWVPGHG